MTSRSGSSPSLPASPLQEARPIHTSEIGSLKRLPDDGTEWLGSSSGVFFVNTVRRAFKEAYSQSVADEHNFPAGEDILAGRDGPADITTVGGQQDVLTTVGGFDVIIASVLGQLPDRKIAITLVTDFFRAWHPLFPFLHGPTFLEDMELLYSNKSPVPQQQGLRSNILGVRKERQLDVRKLITFQLIINIASLNRPETHLPVESRIKTSADVSRVAGVLAFRHDISTIQTLLAAELYLIATIALRAASTVAGMVLRAIFQTGLHRCPLRYAQLSPEDCELRKRIFWSAYALDRHLSQSLGDPITLQDSDIDVCLSGRELHTAAARDAPANPSYVIHLHMPKYEQGMHDSSNSDQSGTASSEDDEKRRREAALTAYVQYSRLTGRVIEIFHKSIHARFPKREAIVYLTSDIETWWNDLPDFLSGAESSDASTPQQVLVPFFSLLYQQLLLLLNRPALSLDPASAEFQHGLQMCIKASRTTLTSLKSHQNRGQTMFLPGLLSANWMAGLIVAFACLLGKYPKTRACTDIRTCLELLRSMNSRYNTAKQCHLVLSSLLTDIEQRKATSTGYLALYRLDKASPEEVAGRNNSAEPATKKRRTVQIEEQSKQVSKRSVPSGFATTAPVEEYRQSRGSNQSPVALNQQSSLFDASGMTNAVQNWNGSYSNFTPTYNAASFQGLLPDYTIHQQSNVMLPDPASAESEDDFGLWNGLNYNMADIFESATWENLVGSAGPVLPDWDGAI